MDASKPPAAACANHCKGCAKLSLLGPFAFLTLLVLLRLHGKHPSSELLIYIL